MNTNPLKHISNQQIITRATCLLAKLRYYVPLRLLKSVYYALFDSPIRNICKIWGWKYNSQIRNFQKVKINAVNVLKFDRNSPNSSKLFYDLGIMQVKDIVNLNNFTFFPQSNKEILAWCLWKTDINIR